ncbi:hypothetical protein [Bdellovibrio svalbardensis]|uniref:Uncharacterized protein n=1 Tax=Bdellovibrio svalbardensis TaxID=2972972 RepID=A0ABT6DH95_9BACT|nr:hypothetical protein [Bdellovibrio svalbardensis]MDG0816186.1 hypothetical protein [Bdellovibrio svalbardensis]
MLKKAIAISLSVLCLATQSYAANDGEALVMSAADLKKNDWSVTFFSIASVANMKPGKTAPDNVSDRMVNSYDYFSLNYRIDTKSKASMRIPFLFNTAGVNEYGDQKTSDFALSDIHFSYSNYDLGYIGDVDVSGVAKLYLPTSKYMQAAKTIAKIRFEGYFDWQFARFSSLEYVVKPDIYLQTQTAFFNPDGIPQYDDGSFMRDPRAATKQFGLQHYLQLNLDINKYVGFQTKTGFDESWYHASAAEEIDASHVTSAVVGVGLEIRPMRGLNFLLLATNETKLNSYRGNDIQWMQPENTEYAIMTNAFLF